MNYTNEPEVQEMPVEEILPNPSNPRLHGSADVDSIARSIKALGFRNPILVDEYNTILAGHGRLLAAKQLGMSTVPVVRFSDMTESQKRAYLVADNRTAELSSWDTDLVVDTFESIQNVDPNFDLTVTGFEVHEIDKMIFDQSKTEEIEEVPTLEASEDEKVATKLGDTWHLGPHLVHCGSSLEKESFDKVLGEDRAEICCTDPPFNVPMKGHATGLGAKTHDEFVMASGEMTREQFLEFLHKPLSLVCEFGKPGMLAYVFIDWRHVRDLIETGETVFDEFKQLCVWSKEKAGMGAFYRSQHELVCIFKKAGAKHVNNFGLGQFGRHRSNVWNYPGMNSGTPTSRHLLSLHPTVKPVAMLADILLDASRPNGVVLDPFGGSGSTLIAAETTGRRARIIELDPRYVDVGVKRWQTFTERDALHAETGETFNERKAR